MKSVDEILKELREKLRIIRIKYDINKEISFANYMGQSTKAYNKTKQQLNELYKQHSAIQNNNIRNDLKALESNFYKENLQHLLRKYE